MKHIIKITLFLVFFSLLIVPSSSFEDTFQYYPDGNISTQWTGGSIVTSGATYSRVLDISSNVGNSGANSKFSKSNQVFKSL